MIPQEGRQTDIVTQSSEDAETETGNESVEEQSERALNLERQTPSQIERSHQNDFSSCFGLSLGRKIYFVWDRCEVGVTLKGGLQCGGPNRFDSRIIFFIDIPAHKWSLPKVNGFVTSTMLEIKSSCIGDWETERGIGGLDRRSAINNFIKISELPKLVDVSPFYRFTSVTAQPHRAISLISKPLFIPAMSPLQSFLTYIKTGQYWVHYPQSEGIRKHLFCSLVFPRIHLPFRRILYFPLQGRGDLGSSITFAFPGTKDKVPSSSLKDPFSLYISKSKRDVISQIVKHTNRVDESTKVSRIQDLAQLRYQRDFVAEINKSLDRGCKGVGVHVGIEQTAKRETLEECCASLDKRFWRSQDLGQKTPYSSVEKVAAAGLLFIACSLLIGVICKSLGLFFEHVFLCIKSIKTDDHQQKND